jgi:hypothetical protein
MNPIRDCVTCRRPFTVPANNPHKRFCSPRCRAADWHACNDHTTNPNTVLDAVATPNGVPSAAPNANAATAANRGQRCPHCHQPIAVIAIVVPPTAAHVHIQELDQA